MNCRHASVVLACVLLASLALPAGAQTPAPALGGGGSPGGGAGEGLDVAASYESREIAGFTCLIRRELAAEEPGLLGRVLVHLEADLDEVVHLAPGPALAALRRTTIWVELRGAENEGMSGRGLCCHWSEEWVVAHGMPAAKAGGVEIVNPRDYVEWHTTQPYMLLHELAHAYHRMLGAETPEIVGAYAHAMEAGLYERVDRNSVALGERVRAYAATNANEYFAEVSEAYLALNDFAPYTRAQLEALDPEGLAMAETLWNLGADEIARRMTEAGLVTPP